MHPRSVDLLRRSRTRSDPSVPTSCAQRSVPIRRARRPSPPVTCAQRRSTREARAFFAPFWTVRLRPNRAQSSFQHPYFAPFRVRSSDMCSQVLFLACDGVGAWQVAPTRCFGAGAAQIFLGEGLASCHASPTSPRGRGFGSVPRRRPSGRRSVLHRTVGHHCRYARAELELALLCSLLTVRSRFRRPQALAFNAAAAAAAAAAIARASGAWAPLAVRKLCPVQPQREHMIVHDGRQLVQILRRTLLC